MFKNSRNQDLRQFFSRLPVLQGITRHPASRLALSFTAMVGAFAALAGMSLLLVEVFPGDIQKHSAPLLQITHIYESRRPNNTLGEFYYMLGTQMAARGQILAAEDLLSKAVKLMPEHADAWMNYGVVLEALDRNEDALNAYSHSVAIDGKSPQSLYTLGLLYDKLGQTQKGIETLLRAYQMDPRNNLIAYDLGVMYSKSESFENSALYSKKALDGAEDFAEAHNNYAYALAHLNRYADALKSANISLELKPDSAAALDTRGFIYQGMGKYQEALADYKKALSLDPTIGEIYLHIAETYEKLNNRDKAVQAYETYLQLTPKASNLTEIQNRIAGLRKANGGLYQKPPLDQAKSDDRG